MDRFKIRRLSIIIAFVILLCAAFSPATAPALGAGRTISCNGTSSMQPIVADTTAPFYTLTGDTIEIEVTDSQTGADTLLADICDIAMLICAP